MKFHLRSIRASFTLALVASAALGVAGCAPSSSGSNEDDATDGGRPPQYVLLAFDGSLNLNFWQESRDFARANNVKFTYFISGVYFLADVKKTLYQGPHHSAGVSEIGFGGNVANIAPRLDQVTQAFNEGHEMGSHASGHFDGHTWSADDWRAEFKTFDNLIFNAAANSGISAPALPFDVSEVVGFRAPQLGYSPGLYTTLAERNYVYDTSKTNATNYWPEKVNGLWNFPLAQLKIVGSGRNTLSMDYNFYMADSKALPDAGNKEVYKQQMIDTYMKYFEGNYFGNRAPVHIGHHFAKWNGGAYWEAMQTFASRVCGLPEVRCVTYGELVSFLSKNQDKLKDFRAGNFNKMPRPPEDDGADIDTYVEDPVPDDQLADEGFAVETSGSHEEELDDTL